MSLLEAQNELHECSTIGGYEKLDKYHEFIVFSRLPQSDDLEGFKGFKIDSADLDIIEKAEDKFDKFVVRYNSQEEWAVLGVKDDPNDRWKKWYYIIVDDTVNLLNRGKALKAHRERLVNELKFNIAAMQGQIKLLDLADDEQLIELGSDWKPFTVHKAYNQL